MQRTQNAAQRMAARAADLGIVAATWLLVMWLRTTLRAWWPYDIIPGEARTLQDLPYESHLEMLAIILPAYAIGLHAAKTYTNLRRTRADALLFRISRGALYGAVLSVLILFLLQAVGTLSRTVFVAFAGLSIPAIFLSRMVMLSYLRYRRRTGQDVHNILVIGTAGEALPLIKTLERHAEWGLRILGVLHPDGEADRETSVLGYKVVGRVRDLDGILERQSVHQVFVTGRAWETGTLRKIADCCEEVGVEFTMDANFLGLTIAQAELHDFEGNSVLTFSSTPRNAEAMVVKRMMDIVLSGAALLALTPVFLVVGAIIKITDPEGPVFFGQQRSGLYGEPFTMWKFRSMVANAEKLKEQLQADNEMDGPVFKMTHDPRITPIGRIIRKTSIDELPQFWNVFIGEMSLVGPRPPIPKEVAQYERWQMRRLSMRPGITCIWQVSGRNNIDFQTWMKLDLQYIDNWSLFLDLKLLLKTPMAVVGGTGK